MTSDQPTPAVSYAEATGGGWFADLCGTAGRLIETGLDARQPKALAHLAARLEHRAEPEIEAGP